MFGLFRTNFYLQKVFFHYPQTFSTLVLYYITVQQDFKTQTQSYV